MSRRKYYTLVVREEGQWAPQFGDYDREIVVSEMADYRDHFHLAKDLKIVTTTGHGTAAIMAVVATLNA